MILGIVAWKQTKKANKTAEESHALSKKMLDAEFEKKYPYVIVKKHNLVEYDNTNINVSVFTKESYRISTETPIFGENKGIKSNKISLFFYDFKQDINKLKQFGLQLTLQNYSETVIQSIKIEKIISILIFKNLEPPTIKTFDINDSFGLSESNVIMPHENMYYNINIASNYEYLNSNIFQSNTTFKMLIKVNTLKNSYRQEIRIFEGITPVTEYKFNIN